MSKFVTVWKYNPVRKTTKRIFPVRIRTNFAVSTLHMDVPDGADLVFGEEAYISILKKIEMAERVCPGTALWREKDEKTVQE